MIPLQTQFPATFFKRYLLYLFRDEFTTDLAAGAVNGTDAEPGPGTRTVVDTNSVISIEDGQLRWNGTPAENDRFRWTDAIPVEAGLSIGWDVPVRNTVAARVWLGLSYHPTSFSTWLCTARATNPSRVRIANENATLVDDYTLGENEHRFVAVFLPSGKILFFARNGLSGDFSLLWVYSNFAVASVYFKMQATNAPGANDFMVDNVVSTILSGNFASEWGLATNRVAIPVDGEVTTQIANAIVEMTWTPAAAEVLDIQIRRTDDDNCWVVRCDQAGSRIYLYRKQAGVETEFGATGGIATTFTAATPYRIVVRCFDARLTVVVYTGSSAAAKQNYTSATFNQSATGMKATGFTVAADLATWPLEVSLPDPFDSMTLAESSTLARISQQTLWSASGSHDWLGRAVLVELANGVWLCVYRSAALHSADTGGRLHVRFSTDEGGTWSAEDTFTDANSVTGMPLAPQVVGKSLPEPVVFQCPNGDIIIHAYERAGGGTSQWRSTNNGATFTYDGVIADATATLTATEIVASDDYVIVGTDIFLIARLDPGSDFTHPHYLVILKSDDNAATWDYVSHVEATLDCNEAGIFNPSGNNLYVIVKDTNNFGTYRYRSADLGATWGAREYITNQVGVLNKPKCKSFGGYHWLYGREIRSVKRTIVYRSADGLDWEPRFYPFTLGFESEDNGYCDILPRANGNIYLLSYAGTESAAGITEAVFSSTS